MNNGFEMFPEQRVNVTRSGAHCVAETLLRHPHVHDVLVFGRVAREGCGTDLDLILISDEGRGADFITLAECYAQEQEIAEVRRMTANGRYSPTVYFNKDLRYDLAQEVLGNEFRQLCREAVVRLGYSLHASKLLDIFVFPPDWREHLGVLQDALPHDDPDFMKNIDRDATSLR